MNENCCKRITQIGELGLLTQVRGEGLPHWSVTLTRFDIFNRAFELLAKYYPFSDRYYIARSGVTDFGFENLLTCLRANVTVEQ